MDAAQGGEVTEPPRLTFRVIAGVCTARLLPAPLIGPPRRSSQRALVCHRAAANRITCCYTWNPMTAAGRHGRNGCRHAPTNSPATSG